MNREPACNTWVFSFFFGKPPSPEPGSSVFFSMVREPGPRVDSLLSHQETQVPSARRDGSRTPKELCENREPLSDLREPNTAPRFLNHTSLIIPAALRAGLIMPRSYIKIKQCKTKFKIIFARIGIRIDLQTEKPIVDQSVLKNPEEPWQHEIHPSVLIKRKNKCRNCITQKAIYKSKSNSFKVGLQNIMSFSLESPWE